MWAYGMCWVVAEGSLVLFVAVRTAVRRAVGLAGGRSVRGIAEGWMVIPFSSMGSGS